MFREILPIPDGPLSDSLGEKSSVKADKALHVVSRHVDSKSTLAQACKSAIAQPLGHAERQQQAAEG